MSANLIKMFDDLDQHDKKSVSFLLKAIEENNLPGFDYLEFKLALVGLREMNMDSTTAIKSAFTTGSTVGLSKSKLIASAEHYKKVLMQEKSQFDNALQNQMTQRVHGKKAQKEKLTGKIETYKAKIAELEAEILKYQDKLNSADSEINAARAKIEDTRDKFEKTFSHFTGQIDQDIARLKDIL